MKTPSKVVSVNNTECLGPNVQDSQQAALEYLYPKGLSLKHIDAIGGVNHLTNLVDSHLETSPLIRTHENGSMTVATCPRQIKDDQCFPFSLSFIRLEKLEEVKEKFADRCNRCLHATQTPENTAK